MSGFWNAKNYEKCSSVQTKNAKQLIAKLEHTPSRIIDLACGIGNITHHLACQFPNADVIGLDVSAEMIHYARQHFTAKNLSFQNVNLYSLNETPIEKQADIVTCFSALRWIKDLQKFWTILYNVLSEQSYCLINYYPDHPSIWGPIIRVMERPNWKERISPSMAQGKLLASHEYIEQAQKTGLHCIHQHSEEQAILFKTKTQLQEWLSSWLTAVIPVPQSAHEQFLCDITEEITTQKKIITIQFYLYEMIFHKSQYYG